MLAPSTTRNGSSAFDVRSPVLRRYDSIFDGSAFRPAKVSASLPRRWEAAGALAASTGTRARNPMVRASGSAWCHRAWAASHPGSGSMPASRNTRMSWAAARAPALRARARPPAWSSKCTYFSLSGDAAGAAGGPAGRMSTMTTSSRSSGQDWPASAPRVRSRAFGDAGCHTTTLTARHGVNVPAGGTGTWRQSLYQRGSSPRPAAPPRGPGSGRRFASPGLRRHRFISPVTSPANARSSRARPATRPRGKVLNSIRARDAMAFSTS